MTMCLSFSAFPGLGLIGVFPCQSWHSTGHPCLCEVENAWGDPWDDVG